MVPEDAKEELLRVVDEMMDQVHYDSAYKTKFSALKNLRVSILDVLTSSDDGNKGEEILRLLGQHTGWEGVFVRVYQEMTEEEVVRLRGEVVVEGGRWEDIEFISGALLRGL